MSFLKESDVSRVTIRMVVMIDSSCNGVHLEQDTPTNLDGTSLVQRQEAKPSNTRCRLGSPDAGLNDHLVVRWLSCAWHARKTASDSEN